jgi:hypothetical protein
MELVCNRQTGEYPLFARKHQIPDYIDQPRQATSGLGALLKAVDDKKIIALEEESTAGIKRRGTHRPLI